MDESSLLATLVVEPTGGSGSNITLAENCTYDGKGGAVCVHAVIVGSLTAAGTVSGSAVPVYTLTVNAAPSGSIRVVGARGRWYISGAILATLLHSLHWYFDFTP